MHATRHPGLQGQQQHGDIYNTFEQVGIHERTGSTTTSRAVAWRPRTAALLTAPEYAAPHSKQTAKNVVKEQARWRLEPLPGLQALWWVRGRVLVAWRRNRTSTCPAGRTRTRSLLPPAPPPDRSRRGGRRRPSSRNRSARTP